MKTGRMEAKSQVPMQNLFPTLTATVPAWGQIAISALIGGIVATIGAMALGRRVRGRAHRNAFSDQLTGIANRRAFEQELESAFRIATLHNDEEVRRKVEENCAKSLPARAEDPLLIGYFIINEPIYENIPHIVPTLKGEHACKRRLVKMLSEK